MTKDYAEQLLAKRYWLTEKGWAATEPTEEGTDRDD